MDEEKKVTVNFQMEQGLQEDLKRLAKKKGISFAGYIRMLCTEAVEHEKEKSSQNAKGQLGV
ncbi:BrnA antitoxin family protein [Pontibacter liquoris]|uniref:BrnA antitoxin family protein n=1 Tax=Pontibacter liquoris TaxID=2905677 RepID=UPI001FA6C634|nr:BrnA antitoxin family protein [Pontibacter liquoris]